MTPSIRSACIALAYGFLLLASNARAAEARRTLLGEQGGIRVQSALPAEKLLLNRLLVSPGGGSAPELCPEDPCSLQTMYSDPQEGNGVLLIWKENAAAQGSVKVSLNGSVVCEVPSLPASEVPGVNVCLVSGLQLSCAPTSPSDPACPPETFCDIPSRPVDPYVFEISRPGSGTQKVCQEVILTRPMAQDADFCCRSGAAADTCAFVPETYGCAGDPGADDNDIVVAGGNTGPPSSFIEIQIEDDGDLVSKRLQFGVDNIFCFQRLLPVATKGTHAVDIFGFVTRKDAESLFWLNPKTNEAYNGLVGAYLMSFHHDVVTPGRPKRPLDVAARQVAYGGGANAVLVTWRPGGPSYKDVHLYLDGNAQPALNVPGAQTRGVLGSLSAGTHKIGVQGDDGAAGGGKSATTEVSFPVLAGTPHTRPVAGSITCRHDAARKSTTAEWTRGDASESIDVYRETGGDSIFVKTIPGSSTSVTVDGTLPADSLSLQFFARKNGDLYGSLLIQCAVSQGKRFVRGNCNGGADIDISSAIFGLTFLFVGGAAPPCMSACDANSDGGLDISDMVFVLGYLFTGGPAPGGWTDSDGDGRPDPTCVPAPAGEDCNAGHAACP